MQFRLFLFIVAATILAATTASANVIKGFKVPHTITKGKPFNLEFKTRGALSGARYFYAAYGFQTTGQNYTKSLGSYLLNGTDLVELGRYDTVPGNFNVSLTVPKNELFQNVEGQSLFSVALYGVGGALNSPSVAMYNQTVNVK